MEKGKIVILSRIIKQTVTFHEDDFEKVEEFDKFVLKMKLDEDEMLDTFYDNVNIEHYEMIKEVILEEDTEE